MSTSGKQSKFEAAWHWWGGFLAAPIDGASLAAFRIIFGITFAVYMATYFTNDIIYQDWVQPSFVFSFVPFIKPLSGPAMYGIYFVGFLASVLIALGLYYRVAATVFFVVHTYIFLLDRTLFLNHTYLIGLLSLLMAIAPANRAYSLDKYFSPEKFPTESIPRWNLLIIKLQLVIVYLYGAFWKINPDWLSGIPCEQFMAGNPALRYFAPFSFDPLFAKLLAYGGIFVDGLVPIFLLIPQTFWIAVALSVAFHLMNSVLFNIGVFPFLMLGTLALFARHDWPRIVFSWCKKWIGKVGFINDKVRNLIPNFNNQHAPVFEQSSEKPPKYLAPMRASTVAMLLFFHVYLFIQLVVPLRHLAYEDNVDWTEEGYYFSWRMMLHQKDVHLSLYAIDPQTGRSERINLRKYLNEHQIRKMKPRPELVHHFAQWYADKVASETGVRPMVRVRCLASLHCRPWHDLIDPRVDLASQPFNLEKKSWILPQGDDKIVDLPNYQQREWYNQMTGKVPRTSLVDASNSRL